MAQKIAVVVKSVNRSAEGFSFGWLWPGLLACLLAVLWEFGVQGWKLLYYSPVTNHQPYIHPTVFTKSLADKTTDMVLAAASR